jgi:adenylyltransferase/sulfurtransferase
MCAVPKMTVTDLFDLQGKRDAYSIIDVREVHEVETSRLKNAIHIPMAFCLSRCNEIPRDIPVILYCRTGARSSATVSALMTKHKFTNLFSLDGGIAEWSKSIDSTIEVA